VNRTGSPATHEDDAAARGRILGRIRSALEQRKPAPHPGAAPGVDRKGSDGTRLQRFEESLRASGGEVVRLEDPEAARRLLEQLAGAFQSAAVSEEVPRALRPALPALEPAAADLGVSVALGGAAATGSLLLSSREGRVLQLLPPVHLVWIEEARIYEELGEALARVREIGVLPATVALHSGPSKSADIGRIVVTGVHGPGRLVAAVTGFPLS
jgi:L-lactate dehydrogenase complex protein LldG